MVPSAKGTSASHAPSGLQMYNEFRNLQIFWEPICFFRREFGEFQNASKVSDGKIVNFAALHPWWPEGCLAAQVTSMFL